MIHRALMGPFQSSFRIWPALMAGACLLLAGCNFYYSRGQALELETRWEEAAIQYHLALIEDPDVEEIREALKRANRVVAKENVALYRKFLAQKQFRKAYARLLDASRQDPGLEAPRKELRKWARVLVAGRVKFDFEFLSTNVSLADEIRLMVRLNTPNPGEVIAAEVDLNNGTFFVEDLLYDRPEQLLANYSLNALGLELVHGRSRIRKFTSREFQRFVNFRTPVVDRVEGKISLLEGTEAKFVGEHRATIGDTEGEPAYQRPVTNPHFSITFNEQVVEVSSKRDPTNFTPRFIYLNKQDRRIFVDFGHYEVRLQPGTRKWRIARLPIAEDDYFVEFSENIALQPYFFYREGVLAFVSGGSG